MEKGSYRGPPVDLGPYAVWCFTPHLFSSPHLQKLGCGPAALALLTGIRPQKILQQNHKAHYSDRFMVTFLRRHGFDVLRLTQCLVSQNGSGITERHVVLLSQLFTRNEGTWGIAFGGIYYHNFRSYALDELSLLNKPVLSAYLICDRKFRLLKATPTRPAKLKARFNLQSVISKGRPMEAGWVGRR